MERLSCLLMNSYRGPPTEFILPKTKKKTKKDRRTNTRKKRNFSVRHPKFGGETNQTK